MCVLEQLAADLEPEDRKLAIYILSSLDEDGFLQDPPAIIARMTRSSMLDVLQEDYIRTAHAKGVHEQLVLFKHALKNAFLPVITIIGIQTGSLLAGAVLTETIFSWPGIGKWVYDAILGRDYPVVQGGTLLIALVFVLVNLLVDLSYAYLDPRIHYE